MSVAVCTAIHRRCDRAEEACVAAAPYHNPDQRGLPMNILRAELVSTAITVLGTTFPQFVAGARHTTMHAKPSDMSVHMTLTRAVELAAEPARQARVQQLP